MAAVFLFGDPLEGFCVSEILGFRIRTCNCMRNVLQHIMQELEADNAEAALVFGAAFGPGLTMETFLASYD